RPARAFPGQQLLDDDRLTFPGPQGIARHRQPHAYRTLVAGRDGDQQVAAPGELREPEDLVMAGVQKSDVGVLLKSAVLPPDAVHLANQVVERIGAAEHPLPDLVLLRVEILLASLAHRNVLVELEPAVYPVDRQQRRREQVADPER